MKRDVELETLREGMGIALQTVALLKAEVARLRHIEARYLALRNVAIYADSGDAVGETFDEMADTLVETHGKTVQ